MNLEASEWKQRPPAVTTESARSDLNRSNEFSPSERAFNEMLELHQHQNVLQQQQNNIMEMLVTQ